jgi:hypothetical protein
MEAKLMDEEQRQLRQSADQDFRRSLDQLETLLEEEVIALAALDPDLLEPADQKADQSHRFGGSILDAIPLANRLGDRLSDPLSGWSKADGKAEDRPPTSEDASH